MVMKTGKKSAGVAGNKLTLCNCFQVAPTTMKAPVFKAFRKREIHSQQTADDLARAHPDGYWEGYPSLSSVNK
jgi:hypothetical protein